MNPELRRTLWLEVSLQRLWLIPAALLGTALLLHISNAAELVMSTLALAAFAAITVFWGARQAASSIVQEARDRTWEIQRMSALSPWTMTWGKLLGATAMPWYAGVICLSLYGNYYEPERASDGVAWILMAILTAITLHAFALLAALVSIHLDRRLRRRLNILVVLFLLTLLLLELADLAIPGMGSFNQIGGSVTWYGRYFDGMAFNVVLLATFAAWAGIGAYRMMCLELEVRTNPWVWFLFICFLAAVDSGFDVANAPERVGRWLSTAAVYACGLSYLAGFAFARDPVQYRRVVQACRERRYRRAIEESPLWISSAVFTLLLALAATLAGSDPTVSNERIDNLGATALALALMMIRDLSLLTYLSFRRVDGRAEVTTLIYIAMLNRLLPALFSLSGIGLFATLCKPAMFEQVPVAVGIAALHAALALVLLYLAYQKAMYGTNPSDARKS